MSDFDNPLLLDPLTEREQAILALIHEGLSNPEIADQLTLGVETVRWYSKQIYSKLGVHSRTQALRRARELGLFTSEETLTSAPPPLVSVNHLPTYPTPLVGRSEELAELRRLLADPNIRLITLVGAGGLGKTRISVEAARQGANQFRDGVYFVPILAAASLDRVLAEEVGLRLHEREEPRTQVLRYLQPKQLLLVLDGFEPALDQVDWVTAALKVAPLVKIMVTSQVSLNLKDEWVRSLEPLKFPPSESEAEAASYSAVTLFAENVRRVRGDFSVTDHLAAVTKICRLVQGIPLALELAATWLRTLSAEDVAREIQRNFDFLATNQRDVEERHRSMQAVFDYSWNLLTAEEQRVFLRLSVFSGQFGFPAAQQVAGASIQMLSELVGKSLLQQHGSGLYEIHSLLHEYAARRLENLDQQVLSARSTKLQTWAALIKGKFDRVEQVANAALASAANSPDQAFALSALGVLAGIDGDYARCRQLCEAGQALIHDDIIAVIFAQLGLSMAYCGIDDYWGAKTYLRAALRAAASLHNPGFNLLCLPVVALVRAAEGSSEQAVELMAAAFTHPESTLDWIKQWAPIQQAELDLQAELGSAEYAAAWERGKALDIVQSVENLLAEF